MQIYIAIGLQRKSTHDLDLASDFQAALIYQFARHLFCIAE
jgi:hypothetical protein